MSPLALTLVLIAALLHASWNIVAKKAGGGSPFVLLTALFVALMWSPVGAWFAWGVLPQWGVFEWGLLLCSGLTHLVYFKVLLRGYRLSDLTVVYPIARGSGPLVSSAGALLVAAISPLGYVLVLYAITMAPLSHVAPAREVSMLFAAILGGRLLGESDRGWRIAGAACIASGVAALALG